jgi:hypothetical protein
MVIAVHNYLTNYSFMKAYPFLTHNLCYLFCSFTASSDSPHRGQRHFLPPLTQHINLQTPISTIQCLSFHTQDLPPVFVYVPLLQFTLILEQKETEDITNILESKICLSIQLHLSLIIPHIIFIFLGQSVQIQARPIPESISLILFTHCLPSGYSSDSSHIHSLNISFTF